MGPGKGGGGEKEAERRRGVGGKKGFSETRSF